MNWSPDGAQGLGVYVAYLAISGANPMIASYNASAVKINNATIRQVRFEKKNIFLLLWIML
jgi:hypothetical protein